MIKSLPRRPNIHGFQNQNDSEKSLGGYRKIDMKEKEEKRYIRFRFRNEDDLREFAQLLNRPNITKKIKSIDYPLIPRGKTTLADFFE